MLRLVVVVVKLYENIDVTFFSFKDFADFIIENGEGRIKDVEVHTYLSNGNDKPRGARRTNVIFGKIH